jgi:hypothetical protein
MGTNRMLALATASQIASASAMSFFCRLTGWRHQSYGMAKCLQLARPMMRRAASLDTNQAWRQFLEERQHVATLQLTTNDYLATSVNAVNLEDRFGDIKIDCGDRLHGSLL